MKKLSLIKIKRQLESIGTDPATAELILNNVQMYNDLLLGYTAGESKHTYLLYQISVQIQKMLESVKKTNKYVGTEDDDPFTSLVNELKNKTVEQR